MENIDIIAILLTIIVVFVAIWLLRQVLIVVAVLIIVGVIAYFVLNNNPNFNLSQSPGNRPAEQRYNLLDEFRSDYCDVIYSREDSIICLYIVEPIYQDIVRNYDLDSVQRLNQTQFARFVLEVAMKNRGKIAKTLRQHKALDVWQDFVTDFKRSYNLR